MLSIPAAVMLPACGKRDDSAAHAEKLLEGAKNLARTTVIVNVRSQAWKALMKLDPTNDSGVHTVDATKDGKPFQLQMGWIGPDMWIAESLGFARPSKWFHLNRSRVVAAGIPDPMPADDPTGAVALVRAMTDITLEKHTYRANIDATKVRFGGLGFSSSAPAVFTVLPVSATIDTEKRLTSIVFGLSGEPEVTYAGFGRTIGEVTVPPAAQTVEMSDQELAALAASYGRS